MRIDCLRTSGRSGRWILGTTVACGMMAAAFLIFWVVPRGKTDDDNAAESALDRSDEEADFDPKEFGFCATDATPTVELVREAEVEVEVEVEQESGSGSLEPLPLQMDSSEDERQSAETGPFHKTEPKEPEPDAAQVENWRSEDGAGDGRSVEHALEAVPTPIENPRSLDNPAEESAVNEAAVTEPAPDELEALEQAGMEQAAVDPVAAQEVAAAELVGSEVAGTELAADDQEAPEPAKMEQAEPEPAAAELAVAETTATEPATPDPPSPIPAEPKPLPANPRAKEAFLKLWDRTPEFDNQLVALFANWQSGPSPYERRRGVERLKADEKAVCVSSEKRWDTVIKNLSVGGAELLHPEPVPRNTRLALVPPSYDQTVTGRVSWVRENGSGFRLGFNFDQDPQVLSESWVAETLLGLGSEFLLKRAPRRYVRVATEVHSRLVTEDGRNIEVVLCDVSLGGCLLQSEEPFQVEELTLRLGSVDCLGKVVNNRQRPDEGWSHHVTFAPMTPLETLRLLRTISSLLKKR